MESFEKEYMDYVEKILLSKEFIKRKKYLHHPNKSVYDHCLEVSYLSFKFAKKHNLNARDIAIGALLHDFYFNPWQENPKKEKFFKKHGFTHARQALENARLNFPELMNDRVEDIIVKHMFPLNKALPKYKESWVVSIIDKVNSLNVLMHPKEYGKFLGFKTRN